MSDSNALPPDRRSWWRNIFGRSLLKAIVGDFFSNKRNTASVLAIILVVTVCWVILVDKKYEYLDKIINVIFVIIGFYFGTTSSTDGDEDDE